MNKLLTISIFCALALSATSSQAGSEDDGTTNNVLYGSAAGASLTTGFQNAFLGFQAGTNTTTGVNNTFSGYQAGLSNITASGNTFSGFQAGLSNTTGFSNTFSGLQAGLFNTTGINNTFLGNSSGVFNTTGFSNTFSGYRAGLSNITGTQNTFSGNQSGALNTTGSGNVFLGYAAGFEETGSNKLYIHSDNASRTIPLIYGEFDTRLLGINGILGVGTQTPTSTLHVFADDGSAQILVEDTDVTVAPRTLFELKNNGNTKFTINNTDANVAWAFANNGSELRFSRQGSGAVEFALTNAGNLTIQGNLTELSSRSQKHNIVAMSPTQILSKVLALPISEWSYKDSQEGTRHIGPMAEDFHQAFGLGESAKGIATLDTSGVALAAIQGLKVEQDKKMAAKDVEILALKTSKILQDKKLSSMQAELNKLKILIGLLGNKKQNTFLD